MLGRADHMKSYILAAGLFCTNVAQIVFCFLVCYQDFVFMAVLWLFIFSFISVSLSIVAEDLTLFISKSFIKTSELSFICVNLLNA